VALLFVDILSTKPEEKLIVREGSDLEPISNASIISEACLYKNTLFSYLIIKAL
jgi:hypothetical protein